MDIFLREALLNAAMLAALGLIGGFLILPFHGRLRYPVLTAPLAGLLAMALGMATLYAVSNRSLATCATATAVACAGATVAGLLIVRPKSRRQDWRALLTTIVVIVSAATLLTEATSIRDRSPALLYMDGRDQVAYAQMADWLSSHTVQQAPSYAADVPYEAYPSWLLRYDPRFGSYFTLALVAIVRRLPAVFSFDIACAVALSAGIMGVAGAFARSRLSLTILLAGLLTCHWYDYSRGSFLGKLLAFPASLFLVGLFLETPEVPSAFPLAALVVLTAATALMHSGLATALFLAETLGGYFVCRFLLSRDIPWRERAAQLTNGFASLIALLVVAVVTTGILARPIYVDFPDWKLPWIYVIPRVLDLENLNPAAVIFRRKAILLLVAAALATWAFVSLAAIKMRSPKAAGLVFGPAVLLLAMLLLGSRAAAFQMIGTFYPFMICSLALLVSDISSFPAIGERSRPHKLSIGLAALAIVCISLRVPRFVGAACRYAGRKVPAECNYSKKDIDQLADKIASRPVAVNVTGVNRTYFVLVELGRRGIPLQWSPQAWNDLLGENTGWPAPTYIAPAPLELTAPSPTPGNVIDKTSQYQLVDPTAIRARSTTDSISR